MSGHSKWATTKHKKAIIDSRRAKLFAKLVKKIEVAVDLVDQKLRETRHFLMLFKKQKRILYQMTILIEP